MSSATAGVILRALVNLEAEGGDTFFGEPEIDPADLLRVDAQGRGVITLLELGDQAARPVMFSTFLMWVLADLFTYLPEVGDVDKPKLVFFFDEAHLLFTDASKAFLQQVEQTVKLIRSKGVGVFFCTQLPTDVPNNVLSQLGARIQHALRAFTPDDQKALTKTVRTYPKTDVYDLETALTSLGIGEAIVTVLSERGAPDAGRLDPAAAAAVADGHHRPGLHQGRGAGQPAVPQVRADRRPRIGLRDAGGQVGAAAVEEPTAICHRCYRPGIDLPPMPKQAQKAEPGMLEQMMDNPAFKSAMRSAGTVIGREITRSIFGTGAGR